MSWLSQTCLNGCVRRDLFLLREHSGRMRSVGGLQRSCPSGKAAGLVDSDSDVILDLRFEGN